MLESVYLTWRKCYTSPYSRLERKIKTVAKSIATQNMKQWPHDSDFSLQGRREPY